MTTCLWHICLMTNTSAVNNWWLSLQHDWYDGFTNNEKVWVSAHRLDTATSHSYLNPSGPTDSVFTSNLVGGIELFAHKICCHYSLIGNWLMRTNVFYLILHQSHVYLHHIHYLNRYQREH